MIELIHDSLHAKQIWVRCLQMETFMEAEYDVNTITAQIMDHPELLFQKIVLIFCLFFMCVNLKYIISFPSEIL